jgi:hypothetical protein
MIQVSPILFVTTANTRQKYPHNDYKSNQHVKRFVRQDEKRKPTVSQLFQIQEEYNFKGIKFNSEKLCLD